MAGITAVSISASHLTTALDTNVGGFIVGEQITLATNPTGSTYSWAISKPGGATSRSDLTDATAAAPKFTPDVGGYYTVSVTVDSTTTYVLRINVTQTAAADTIEALRFAPKADANVPTPPLGVASYYSTDESAWVYKDTAGTVHKLQKSQVVSLRHDTPQSVADGSFVALVFDTDSVTDSAITLNGPAGSRTGFTVPTTGLWQIQLGAILSASVDVSTHLRIKSGGITIAEDVSEPSTGAGVQSPSIAGAGLITVGTAITAELRQDNTANTARNVTATLTMKLLASGAS